MKESLQQLAREKDTEMRTISLERDAFKEKLAAAEVSLIFLADNVILVTSILSIISDENLVERMKYLE